MAAFETRSKFGLQLEKRLRKLYPDASDDDIYYTVIKSEKMLKSSLMGLISQNIDTDTMIEAAQKSSADQKLVAKTIRNYAHVKLKSASKSRDISPSTRLQFQEIAKVKTNYVLSPDISKISSDRLADFIYQDVVDFFDLPPLSIDLNSEHIKNAKNRGLVMCHGRTHRQPRLPQVSDIDWVYADRNSDFQPDIIADYTSDENLRDLGYFEHVVNHHCPTAKLGTFFYFLYKIRQVTVPGSHVYHLTVTGLVREIYSPLIRLGIGKIMAVAVTLDVYKKLTEYCGFRDMTIRTKLIPDGVRERIEIETMMRIGGAIMDVIC